jgi:integrase
MQALTPFGKTLADAVAHYTEYLSRAAKSATVADLRDQYLVALKADGRGPRHLSDVKSRIGRFCDDGFADRLVSTVETREVDDWLRALELSPTSRNNMRTVAHGFFSFAIARGYCISNPVAGTAKAKVVRVAPEIFRPDQIRSLLAVADSRVLPALVIGAFAGLRSAEIDRLDWSEVNLSSGFIEVKSSKSKSGARRLVTIQPNLKTWLAPLAHQSGPVRAPFWTATHLMAEARTAAKLVKWPDNGLRHSFASYHLAQFKNAAGLALELGHTTSGLLFAHYRELVTPDAAAQWWSIRPAADATNMVQFDQAAAQA